VNSSVKLSEDSRKLRFRSARSAIIAGSTLVLVYVCEGNQVKRKRPVRFRFGVKIPSGPRPTNVPHQPKTWAKISGAQMDASLWIMNFGDSGSSLYHVIFSLGTAPL